MEMTKRVKCESCGGKGMIIPKKHGGMVVPRKCEHCNGTGTTEAPITNADRIRAMNDEELAENLCDKRLTKEMWLKWLKHPAE